MTQNSNTDFHEILNFNNIKEAFTNKHSRYRIGLVDVLSGISLGFVFGVPLDYMAGFRSEEIIWNRLTATPINALSNPVLGIYSEFIYRLAKVEEKSHFAYKRLVDSAIASSFHPFVYGSISITGSFLTDFNVEWDKVQDGMLNVFFIAPFLGPFYNYSMNQIRKLCGVDSFEQKASYQNKPYK